MYYYGVIDERDIITEIYESETVIEDYAYVPLPEVEDYSVYVGMWYDRANDQIVEAPLRYTAVCSTDEINLGYSSDKDKSLSTELQNMKSNIALKAAHDHNHDSDYAAIDHTHDYAASTHSHTASDVGAAPASHNHDAAYAALGHNHDAAYAAGDHDHTPAEIGAAPASHTHDYAASDHTHTAAQVGASPSNHNHDAAYAGISHGHSAADVGAAASGHNHDSAYAALSHNHDGRYYTESEVDTKLAEKAASGHTHTAADVGAMSSSGGTMAGNLQIQKGNTPALELRATNNGEGKARMTKNASASADYGTQISDYSSDGKRSVLTIRNVNALANKLVLTVEKDDGSLATYYLYGDHNKPDDLYVPKNLQFTSDNGGVEVTLTTDDNLLTAISNLSAGMHTLYSPAGTAGNPNLKEHWRVLVYKTGGTIGWVQAFGRQGSYYINHQTAAGTFLGWTCIHDNAPDPLWAGGSGDGGFAMSASQTVTPSKPLANCRNGWMLIWADYDPDTATYNNYDFHTTFIPKRRPDGTVWSGQSNLFAVASHLANASPYEVETIRVKTLMVHNTKLVGHAANVADDRSDIVLKAVYEF